MYLSILSPHSFFLFLRLRLRQPGQRLTARAPAVSDPLKGSGTVVRPAYSKLALVGMQGHLLDMCMCVYLYTHMCTYMCTCTCIYIYIYISRYMYVYIFLYMCRLFLVVVAKSPRVAWILRRTCLLPAFRVHARGFDSWKLLYSAIPFVWSPQSGSGECPVRSWNHVKTLPKAPDQIWETGLSHV